MWMVVRISCVHSQDNEPKSIFEIQGNVFITTIEQEAESLKSFLGFLPRIRW